MLSLLVWPKVITLSGFFCIMLFQKLFFSYSKFQTKSRKRIFTEGVIWSWPDHDTLLASSRSPRRNLTDGLLAKRDGQKDRNIMCIRDEDKLNLIWWLILSSRPFLIMPQQSQKILLGLKVAKNGQGYV